MKVNHKQLIFAREYRGMSQTELAKSVKGLSQSNLSKYEKGLGGLSDEVLQNIFKVLNFPASFFEKKMGTTLETANYRKKSSIPKSLIKNFETLCIMLGYIVDELSDSVDFPDFTLKTIDIEDGYTPTEIAIFTRKNFRILADEPIHDIFRLIENKGVVIYEINTDEKFDGISMYSKKGTPIIVINKRMSNDRKRFTLAHELGHLIMHCSSEFPVPKYRDKEQEANEFASEFLMPTKAIRSSLEGLMYRDLHSLKKYWLTSKSSIVRRAYDLNAINRERYMFFNIELSRNRERKRESEIVSIDEPSIFEEAMRLHFEELGYSSKDIAEAFSISSDVIDFFYSIQQNNKPILRIL
ncbi:MAG: XRE family transcriptional regulator [Bacteroidota bacterium]|nr:XRE family transcriptional regulator [Bacteroidota bacterium]